MIWKPLGVELYQILGYVTDFFATHVRLVEGMGMNDKVGGGAVDPVWGPHAAKKTKKTCFLGKSVSKKFSIRLSTLHVV